ncbi:hypothetical protein UCRPA7_6035 [Phaeoacremonium minimum UCRPA7]|uniref:GPI anchored serine-rich protein n=1 Tax=Phaeoacremonium minimum (strain UCR-PA7) TaxID=1286976 RepID=R8BGK7_PHAM7|nr:hypothetical protein UCRPA7_6035 [Phaeoacremonium minimum UCRPA7]EON98470.1 hypothetical protein UCRPA7_6035 [Phaeoacremonium minimum UCRPA7]
MFYIVVALAALAGVEAQNSTVTIGSAPPFSSTPDVVTRSPVVPTGTCTEPLLTVISNDAELTSTLTTTSVYTITSCPPTVTDCPVGSKTTEIISYTHVYPAASTPGGGSTIVTSVVPGSNGTAPASPSPTAVVTAGASGNKVISIGGVFALVAVAAGYIL